MSELYRNRALYIHTHRPIHRICGPGDCIGLKMRGLYTSYIKQSICVFCYFLVSSGPCCWGLSPASSWGSKDQHTQNKQIPLPTRHWILPFVRMSTLPFMGMGVRMDLMTISKTASGHMNLPPSGWPYQVFCLQLFTWCKETTLS